LRLDFQDLHANLYFGDTEDLFEVTESLKISVENVGNPKRRSNELADLMQWNKSLNNTPSHRIPGIPAQSRFFLASYGNGSTMSILPRKGANRQTMIFGLDCIDTAMDTTLGLAASINSSLEPEVKVLDACRVFAARALYIELPAFKDFDLGLVNTDGKDMKLNRAPSDAIWDIWVPFKNAKFSSSPSVVVWIVGISCQQDRNFRAIVSSENVSNEGFTLRMKTWWDTKLRWISAGWFAYPKDSKLIKSDRASYTKRGEHSDDVWVPTARIKWDEGFFSKPPRVFTAITSLDFNNRYNPRFKIYTSNITETGMRLSGHTWSDTDNYGSSVCYIAFSEEFFNQQ
jgi:hypothetical protein